MAAKQRGMIIPLLRLLLVFTTEVVSPVPASHCTIIVACCYSAMPGVSAVVRLRSA